MIYIAIEGPNGSGKTTVARALADYINSSRTDMSATVIREPSDPLYMSAMVNAGASQEMLAGAFMMDRAIQGRALCGYDVVISDRCYLSTFVYQQDVDRGLLIYLVDRLPRRPDLIVVLLGRHSDNRDGLSALDMQRDEEIERYRSAPDLYDNIMYIDDVEKLSVDEIVKIIAGRIL